MSEKTDKNAAIVFVFKSLKEQATAATAGNVAVSEGLAKISGLHD